VHGRDRAGVDVLADLKPGCGPVAFRDTVVGALPSCDPCLERGAASVSVAGTPSVARSVTVDRALAKSDASAAGPSRPG